MTLNEYLDAAIVAGGFASDKALGRHLGYIGGSISAMRTGRMLPSDETMVRLAVMVGVPPEIALMDLNIWRAGGNQSRAAYRRIKDILKAELGPRMPQRTQREQVAISRS